MVGVSIGERSSAIVNGWCVDRAGRWPAPLIVCVPAGPHVIFGGSFVVDDFARFLKILALIGSAARSCCRSTISRSRSSRSSNIGPDPARDARHDDADLGRRPDRALSRPRTDEPAALRDRGDRTATTCKSTEAGLKYFVLGALSSGMLLYGASLIYGFTGTVSFAGIAKATQGGASIGLDLRPGVPVRRLLLQDFRGAVPHVDARRL